MGTADPTTDLEATNRVLTPSVSGRWTTRQAIITVLIVAGLLRLWIVASIPLVITNDGVGYLVWGQQIAESGLGAPDLLPWRTPGYPVFLALVFKVFGYGPVGVLVAQHLLGVAICGIVAWLGCRLGSARLGTAAGLLCCLDPWLLMFGSFALSETLAAALLVLSIALVLGRWRSSTLLGLTIGICLGSLTLVRPLFLILWPFVALAWLIQSAKLGWARGLICTAALAVGLVGTMTPWVVHSYQKHGNFRLAQGSGAFMWWGLQRYGLIDPTSCPADEQVQEAYAPWIERNMLDDDFLVFSRKIDGMGTRETLLRRWAWDSIRRRPDAYLSKFAEALGWQLNWFPSALSEPDWFIRYVANGGGAVCFYGDPAQVEGFLMSASGGWLRKGFKYIAQYRIHGLPQALLALGALVLVALALLNRQWDAAIVFAGTLAVMAAYAVLLSSTNRYALPIWVSWYVTVAAVPGGIRALRTRQSWKKRE